MATIYPFRPIRPNPFFADQLVFTKPQTESVSGDYTKAGGLKPLKTLLETGARLRPETEEGQALAYRDIAETLEGLLEKEQLWREPAPGIFVYEVQHKAYRQTGIWALTALEDYRAGNIKLHELTFADSVRRIKYYREHTRLEGSPILLTYSPDTEINRIIVETKANPLKMILGNQQGFHKLWKIEDKDVQQRLMNAFARVATVYMADGHHRITSATELAQCQKENSLPICDTISSLYMATDQLRIEPYDRVAIPENPVNPAELFQLMNQHFYMQESAGNHPVRPKELHRMGMCFKGEWYHLLAKPHTYENKNEAERLDSAILQEQVLTPIFGIADPKTDQRLKCAGGEKALEEIGAILLEHPGAIAFTLCPLSVDQLITVACAGQVLPPKSTWIVPKIPYGLLIHQHL